VRAIWSEEAQNDLVLLWSTVAIDDVSAADRTVDRIDAMADLIAGQPGMGRAREDLARGLRSFAVSSWVLFYRLAGGSIEVVRILHGRRDHGAVF